MTTVLLFSLTACTKEESVDAGFTGREIQFSSGVTVQAKSSASVEETDTNILKTDGFKVAGIWKGTSEYLNGTASYDTHQKRYKLDETKYWPAEGGMEFYGVYPKSTVINTTVPASPFITFEGDGQTDLVTARASASNQDVADLPFSHSLARVTVKCKGESGSSLTYKVKAVKAVTSKSAKYDFTHWYDFSSTREISIYDGSGITLSNGPDFTAIDGAITVFPTEMTLKVEYEIYQNGILIQEEQAEAVIPEVNYPQIGHSNVYQCTLSNNASLIQFTVSVNDWLTGSYDVEL